MRGVAVVPLLETVRERELEAELATARAELAAARAELEAHASQPAPCSNLAVLGGGLVAEWDGWLWLVWRGGFRRLERATDVEQRAGDVLRGVDAAALAERLRNAS